MHLLRVEFLRNDIILSLLLVIKEMHAWFYHSDDLYIRLLSDLLLLFSSPTGPHDNRNFITTIFTQLFYIDPSFLYDSFRLMDRESFTELLSVLDASLNFAPILIFRDFDFDIPTKVRQFSRRTIITCLGMFTSIQFNLLHRVDRTNWPWIGRVPSFEIRHFHSITAANQHNQHVCFHYGHLRWNP